MQFLKGLSEWNFPYKRRKAAEGLLQNSTYSCNGKLFYFFACSERVKYCRVCLDFSGKKAKLILHTKCVSPVCELRLPWSQCLMGAFVFYSASYSSRDWELFLVTDFFFFKVCKRLWAFVFPSQLDVFWNAVQQTASHLNVLWSILLIRKESKRHFQCCRHLASCGILMTRISSLQVPVMSHAFSRSFFNIAAPLVNKRKEYSERRIIGFV